MIYAIPLLIGLVYASGSFPNLLEAQELEVVSRVASLSSIRSRIRGLKELEADITLFCSHAGDASAGKLPESDCAADDTTKDSFLTHLMVWQERSVTGPLQDFASEHSVECLASLFRHHITKLFSEAVVFPEIRGGFELSNSLKLRREIAISDHSHAYREFSDLQRRHIILANHFRRFMHFFVPVVNYLLSYSVVEETDSSASPPTDASIELLNLFKPVVASTLQSLMSISNIEPNWYALPVVEISRLFSLLRLQIETFYLDHPDIPKNILWKYVIEPLYNELRINPEIRKTELEELAARLHHTNQFLQAIRAYLDRTSVAIFQLDEILSELVSLGFNPMPQAELVSDDPVIDSIVSSIMRLVESDN